MGPDGAVNILFRKQLAAAESDEARAALREELVAGVRATIDPFLSARMGFVDDVIRPGRDPGDDHPRPGGIGG